MPGGVKNFRLDTKGIGNILRGPAVRRMVNGVAYGIGAAAQAGGYHVIVRPYTNDRAAALIVLAERNGVELQAKHGVLTRAAASTGAEVRSK